MCLGIPAKVIKIKGRKARVSQGDHTHEVDLSLLSQKIKNGDYLLVAKDKAINKIKKGEAEKILKILAER